MLLLKQLASWAFLGFMALSSLLFYLLALLIRLTTGPWDKRLFILHRFTSMWAYLYVWLTPPWKVRRLGREKIDTHQTYVVVSNHQSALDILVAFGLFFHFKWVSKAEMFKVPFIGWNMSLNRYIKLVRGNKESIIQMLADCKNALSRGSSVFMFPEGSRSKTGRLKEFKPGAFILAKEMELPILPIAIKGTTDALPKKSLTFQGSYDISIRVLDAIPFSAFKDLSVDDTAAMVRAVIAGHVEPPQIA